MVPLNFVLAASRFTILCYQPPFATAKFFYVLCGLCYTWGVLVITCCLTPFVGLIFVPASFVWRYDDSPLSTSFAQVDFVLCLSFCAISLFVYIVIVLKLLIMKKQMHMSNQQNRHEIAILIQAILIFLYCSFFMSAWHFYELFLPDCRWTYFAINTLWILNSGITSFLYLTMNQTIRRRFYERYFTCFHSTPAIVIAESLTPETRRVLSNRISPVSCMHT
ncbi:hypothetical protein Tcan_03488 [Toxocara canis]|uniref:7TM GPCR serpentine receptor class x (Srx) domain-containing protein n=1 Tax=Toxocara canis TaxID=6265 RepID=A0A0B2VJL9_TOXCA|nr:hypothetical protein Tcan_03488 [Toxocara canis]